MRLICPHCMSGVTVPDDAAGTEVPCPNCGKSFPTPARYSAEVVPEPAPAPPPVPTPPAVPPSAPPAVAAAPAGYVPPAPLPPVPPADGSGFLPPPGSSDAPVPAGYTHSRGLTISPTALAWLPPILLTLALVFTFFPWVGSFAGHSAVYTQRPWGSILNRGVSRNFALEKIIPPTGWLERVTTDAGLMIPFLLCLVLAVVIAWADRVYRAGGQPRGRAVQRMWPHRQGVVSALAFLALMFAVIQLSRGFGMERAMRQVVNESVADQRAKDPTLPTDPESVEYDVDQGLSRYHLETTTWAWLAVTFLALALVAAFLRWWLDRRTNRLPPRIVLYY